MRPQVAALIETLAESGLMNEASPIKDGAPSADGRAAVPWYMNLLLALAGWLSALALLGLIALITQGSVFDNGVMSLLCGAALTGGAAIIFHANRKIFVEHLALSFSFAGQAFIALALYELCGNEEEIAGIGFALLQVFLAVTMPSFTHRVISAFVAVGVLYMSLGSWGAQHLVTSFATLLVAWCWLSEFDYPTRRRMARIRSVGYGALLALIAIHLHGLRENFFDWLPLDAAGHSDWLPLWAVEGMGGAAFVYVVWRLLGRHGVSPTATIAIEALVAAILLGFAGSNRILVGLGALALFFYVAFFYYNLDTSLLAKSATLFFIGLAMLILRWLMAPRRAGAGEVQHG